MSKIDLGGLFYPSKDAKGRDIPFDSLYIPFIYKEIYFDGVYIDVLNQRDDMVIMDVGANIGVTVQHFQNKAKKVYAIEPAAENFAALKKNVEYNKWDNVEIFNYAMNDKDEEVELHLNSSNRTCHSLALSSGGDNQMVRGISFETFFKENNIKEIDFMKFDVEGAEDIILRSDSFRRVCKNVKSVLVEFHFPTWQQLAQYMIDLGYQARRFKSDAIIILFTR